MAAIKIRNEKMIERTPTISYQIGKNRGTSTTFDYFVTQLLSTGFLVSAHILICDNTTIHLTRENTNQTEILWEDKKLVLNLPPYAPDLNHIELVFLLLGHCLRHSNTRHLAHQMKCDNFFLLRCIEVLESISRQNIMKTYKK